MFEQEISFFLIPQSLIALLLWIVLVYVVTGVANTRLSFRPEYIRFLTVYFILLSTVAVVRLFFTILPVTSDSFYYLNLASAIQDGYRPRWIGSGVYAYYIALFKDLTYGNIIFLLFINVAIYTLAVTELLRLAPAKISSSNRNLMLGILLAYPAIYWFIPNILREALFILAIVFTFSASLKLIRRAYEPHHLIILLLAAAAACVLRPQVLLIMLIWVTYMVCIRWPRVTWGVPLAVLAAWRINAIRDTILSKVSFAYLQAFKVEAAADLDVIRFSDQIIPTNWGELLIWLPYVFLRFMLAPWPWSPASLSYTFAWLDALFCLFLLGIIIWRIIRRQMANWHLLIYAIAFLVVFSVFEIAFTGAVRHRMPYMLMLIPLVAGRNQTSPLPAEIESDAVQS